MADERDTPGAAARAAETPLSLLARARARDEAAWARLVDLYRPLVASWCRRSGLRGADAEDVEQEAFAAAAAGLDGFRRDRPGDTFRGWLRTVTRNQILLFFRRNRDHARAEGGSDAVRRLEDLADPLPDAPDEEAAEVGVVFRRAVEQVRVQFQELTWQAFWLTAVEGRSPAALADELGMSPAAIRQAKSRVLRRLKQEMGEVLD
jgi:RNA polymerase sigma-70 factor (ECF subfamily)